MRREGGRASTGGMKPTRGEQEARSERPRGRRGAGLGFPLLVPYQPTLPSGEKGGWGGGRGFQEPGWSALPTRILVCSVSFQMSTSRLDCRQRLMSAGPALARKTEDHTPATSGHGRQAKHFRPRSEGAWLSE